MLSAITKKYIFEIGNWSMSWKQRCETNEVFLRKRNWENSALAAIFNPLGQKRKDSRASANGVKCKPGGPLRPLRPAHNLAATYNSLVSTHTRIRKQLNKYFNKLWFKRGLIAQNPFCAITAYCTKRFYSITAYCATLFCQCPISLPLEEAILHPRVVFSVHSLEHRDCIG